MIGWLLKRKGDHPDYVCPKYLRKQLRVFEEALSLEKRENALIWIASHLGESCSLGKDRSLELSWNIGRSLSQAESQKIIEQARAYL